MKKLINIIILSILTVSIAHAQDFEFQKSPNFSKLDLRARNAWIEAMKAGDTNRKLKCMVKVSERMSQSQKGDLVGAGFEAATIIQTIVTGEAKAGSIPKIAGLGFVQAIELSVPLDIKNDPGYKKYEAPAVKKDAAPAKPKEESAKGAAAAKPSEKTPAGKSAQPAAATGQTPAAPKVVAPEPATPAMPIYQSMPRETPTQPAFPNMPTTSDEPGGAGGEPAIAPVDQAQPEVREETRPTFTEPYVQPAKTLPPPPAEAVPSQPAAPAKPSQGVQAVPQKQAPSQQGAVTTSPPPSVPLQTPAAPQPPVQRNLYAPTQ